MGFVSDPAILAAQGDEVLLVLGAQNTRKEAHRESMRRAPKLSVPMYFVP